MPQLTGLLTGTSQSDLFTGSLEVVDLTANTTEVGIENATINALSGDDTIESIVTLTPGAGDLLLSATGILGTTINAGAGNDTVIGKGIGSRFFEGFGTRGPQFSGAGLGYGLRDSVVNGGTGNDTLTFVGEGEGFVSGLSGETPSETPRETPRGVGIWNATVNGGSGADKITADGVVGGLSATVHGGAQQDEMTIQGDETALDQSLLGGGADDDTITVNATNAGRVQAVLNTQIRGGEGNDTIDILGEATPISARGLPASTSVAVEENSVINGGAGNDTISVRSETAATGGADATALKNATLAGGAGNDVLSITANASGFGGTAQAALDAKVNGGSGDDTMTFEAFATGSGVNVSAAENSTIRGGTGNDTLSFKIGGNTGSANGSAAIIDSRVYGNAGNDRFTVTVEEFSVASADRQPEYDIKDALIFGGAGDDTFDVGIGNATLNGGTGADMAILDYFNAETTSVAAIVNGVQLVGTQTRNGTEGSWTQRITGTESFQIGETTYTAESLVSTFAA